MTQYVKVDLYEQDYQDDHADQDDQVYNICQNQKCPIQTVKGGEVIDNKVSVCFPFNTVRQVKSSMTKVDMKSITTQTSTSSTIVAGWLMLALFFITTAMKYQGIY